MPRRLQKSLYQGKGYGHGEHRSKRGRKKEDVGSWLKRKRAALFARKLRKTKKPFI